MNTGMASDIPVQLFLLDPFFNVFNRWQLPLQFFRQAVGYFIRTDAHGLGHILECIFRHQVIFALTQQQANRGMIIHGICASAACTISKFGKRSANFAIYLRFRTEYPFALDILPYSAKESNWLSTAQMKRLYKHVVLSIITITRVRQSHFAGRQAHRRSDPCAGERSDGGVKNSSPGGVFRESQSINRKLYMFLQIYHIY